MSRRLNLELGKPDPAANQQTVRFWLEHSEESINLFAKPDHGPAMIVLYIGPDGAVRRAGAISRDFPFDIMPVSGKVIVA